MAGVDDIPFENITVKAFSLHKYLKNSLIQNGTKEYVGNNLTQTRKIVQ